MTTEERLEFDRLLSLIKEEAYTEMGKKDIGELRPMIDPHRIRDRYRFIREGMDIDAPFYAEKNLSRIISSIEEGEVLLPEQLLEVSEFFDFLDHLLVFFDKQTTPYLFSLVSKIISLDAERKRIVSVITRTGDVVNERIKRTEVEVNNLKQTIKKTLGETVTIRDGRYVIPVSAKSKANGIVHDISRGGKTLFLEPIDCVPSNNEIEIKKKLIDKEKKKVLNSLSASLREKLSEIKNDIDVLGKYDEIMAISNRARKSGWAIPEMEGSILKIRQGRHPLLKGDVVPLDMEIGREYNTLLITGPNMGGKTVALKTIGILSIMANSGIPVPASSDSQLPIFDRLFADIGDESSIDTGESSFSFHLKEMKKMLVDATDKSLILIDEIDRGTEPDGGRAISQAFLEEFTRKKVTTIVTSHSTALKFFVREKDGMENGRMETRDSIPTYRLRIGFPGESLWLETARSVGIDEKIIKRAEDFTDKKSLKIDQIIREMEEEREKMSITRTETEKEREMLSLAMKKTEETDERLKEELKRLRRQKKTMFIEARKGIENLVREIKETNASKESIVKAKKEIEKETIHKGEKKTQKQIMGVGDTARVRSPGMEGKIVSIDGDRITILVNGIRITLPAGMVDEVKSEDEGPPGYSIKFTRDVDLKDEINIRGLRVDDAILSLEKYIDDTILFAGDSSADRRFRIIHGIGKGILKEAVWKYLSKDKRIESFELAPQNEGGDGVTVVETYAF